VLIDGKFGGGRSSRERAATPFLLDRATGEHL
jgi:hypothetical protein